jgi:ArsR family transcriptional regulator
MTNVPRLTRCCVPRGSTIKPAEAVRYARLFRALGDPTRIEILGIMARRGAELNVCDVEDCFDLSQPTISHHLRILREAGLVETERRGQCICYSLRDDAMDALDAFRAALA